MAISKNQSRAPKRGFDQSSEQDTEKNSSQNLCSDCKESVLQRLLELTDCPPDWQHTKSVSRVDEAINCELCSHLRSVHNTALHTASKGECYLLFQKNTIPIPEHEYHKTCGYGPGQVFQCSWACSAEKYNIRLVKAEEVPINRLQPFSTPTQPYFDFKTIREWIDICVENHKLCATKKRPSQLRCIDTKTAEVVHIEANEPFVALSYVWGNDILHPRANYKTGDKLNLRHLPQTLKDAMIATALLGERFLWVDCLCIDQTDNEDFEQQISQMHLIYGCAILTLVTLGGRSNNEGIPGIISTPMGSEAYRIATKEGVVSIWISKSSKSMWKFRDKGSWSRRGWTYQEAMVSSRCVYFGKHQVLFRCRMACGSEISSPYLCDRHATADNDDIDIQPLPSFITSKWDTNIYHFMVARYSSRTLANPTDKLYAFTAIMQQWTEGCGMRFFSGLPQTDLLTALTWDHDIYQHPVLRRSDYSPTRRLRGFPSWSWAGWMGSITPPLTERLLDCADCKVLDGGGTSPKIYIVGQVRRFRISRWNGHRTRYGVNHFDDSMVMDYKHIPTMWLEDLGSGASGLTEFLRLGSREGNGNTGGDQSITLLLRRFDNGTCERVGMAHIPTLEWNKAPVISEAEPITLV